MRCPFCGTENENSRTTCIACGSPLQIPQPTVQPNGNPMGEGSVSAATNVSVPTEQPPAPVSQPTTVSTEPTEASELQNDTASTDPYIPEPTVTPVSQPPQIADQTPVENPPTPVVSATPVTPVEPEKPELPQNNIPSTPLPVQELESTTDVTLAVPEPPQETPVEIIHQTPEPPKQVEKTAEAPQQEVSPIPIIHDEAKADETVNLSKNVNNEGNIELHADHEADAGMLPLEQEEVVPIVTKPPQKEVSTHEQYMPQVETPPLQQTATSQSYEELDALLEEKSSNKIVTILIFVVGFVILVSGGFYGYKIISNILQNDTTDTNDENQNTEDIVVEAKNFEVSEVAANNDVKLVWEQPDETIQGYSLEIMKGDAQVDDSIDIPGSDTTYTVNDLEPGESYMFILKTVSLGGIKSEGVSVKAETAVIDDTDDDSESYDDQRIQDMQDLVGALDEYYMTEGAYPKGKNYASMLNSLIAKKLITRFMQDPTFPENEYVYNVSGDLNSYTLKVYFDRPEFVTMQGTTQNDNYIVVTVNASERSIFDEDDENNDDTTQNDLNSDNLTDDDSTTDTNLLPGALEITTVPADGKVKRGETLVFSVKTDGSKTIKDVSWVLDEQNGVVGKGSTIKYQYDVIGNYKVSATITYKDDSTSYGETTVVITK